MKRYYTNGSDVTNENLIKGTIRSRAINWLFVFLYALMIFILSSLSDPLPLSLPDFIFLDKIVHFFEYAFFGFLVFKAFSQHTSLKKSFFLTIIMVSFYGVTDEAHQYFVQMREADVMDWLADSAGGVTGASLAFMFYRGGSFE